MTNVGYATLSVIPSFNGFQRNLDRGVAPGLASSGKSAGKRFGTSFGSAVRGTIAGLGIFSAGSAAIRFLGDSVAEGRESVRIGRQTAAVIKSTGGVAKVSEKQVGRLANTLSRVGGVDDEIVQGGANILLTFKNIRNEAGENNKVFDKANKAALNLSTALGKDLNSSALMVGKALNDPVAGMLALGRAGVQFSADQKDAIKRMVETGDTLGAQKTILRELNEQFRGSARAQRTEADKLSVAWGNFKEEIGQQLIPVLDDLAKFLRTKGIPRAKEFFNFVRDDGVPAMKKVAGFAEDAAGQVKALVDAFNGMPGWVKKVLIGGFAGGVVAKKLGLGKVAGAAGSSLISRGASPANPLYVLDVSGAAGEGSLGKGSKVFGALAKGGLLAAFGLEAYYGSQTFKENMAGAIKGAIQGGGRGTPFGGKSPANPLAIQPPGIGASQKYIDQFNASLDKTERHFVTNKREAEEFGRSVRERIPRTVPIKITGWQAANQDVDAYIAKLAAARAAQKLLNFSPSGEFAAVPGQAPNHSPGGGGGGKGDLVPAGRRGAQIIIQGDVRPNDSREFFADLQRRSISAAGDGWPSR